MLQITNRGFKKSYVYGGSGIFDSIASAASRLLGKEAVKRAATQAIQSAAKEAGKKLGEKAVQKVASHKGLTSESRDILNKYIAPESRDILNKHIAPESQDILNKYTAPKDEFNLNSLISGSAIRIQDYVKRAPTRWGFKK